MTDVRANLPHILAEHRKWRLGDGGARANLARADLTSANLAGAYLARADLADANLTGADLSGACLTGAYLARANLARADLTSADLADANLTGAKHLIDGGQRLDGYRFVGWIKEGALMIRAGCRNMTVAEYRAHNAKREDAALRAETDAILSHIEAVAVARGLVVS